MGNAAAGFADAPGFADNGNRLQPGPAQNAVQDFGRLPQSPAKGQANFPVAHALAQLHLYMA